MNNMSIDQLDPNQLNPNQLNPNQLNPNQLDPTNPNLGLTLINIYIMTMIYLTIYFIIMIRFGPSIKTFFMAFIISGLIINAYGDIIIQRSI